MITIESSIEIYASAQRVWDCLMDFNQYPKWNPMIPKIVGQAKTGELLTVRLTPPGLASSNYVLTVLTVTPCLEFRWLGHKFFPGMMDGNHAFLIKSLSSQHVLLTQSESFKGLMVPFLAFFLKNNIHKGFEQMNRALKQRVESTVPKI